jgi:hypothetical protein
MIKKTNPMMDDKGGNLTSGKTFITKTWDRISLSYGPVMEYIP